MLTLAERIDKQMDIITEGEVTWAKLRDELAEVHVRLQMLPVAGARSPRKPGPQ